MFPLPPRYLPLMLAAFLSLVGCATSPENETVEAPLQPPPSFCDLSAAAPDDADASGKKSEHP